MIYVLQLLKKVNDSFQNPEYFLSFFSTLARHLWSMCLLTDFALLGFLLVCSSGPVRESMQTQGFPAVSEIFGRYEEGCGHMRFGISSRKNNVLITWLNICHCSHAVERGAV